MRTQPYHAASGSDAPRISSLARHPYAALTLASLAGLVASSGVVWVLVTIADQFADKSLVARIDDSVVNQLTLSGSVPSDGVLNVISLLGSWALLALVVAVIAALVARRDWPRAAAVTVASTGAVLLNAALKVAFDHAHSVTATSFTSAAQSWNFPSGHAINALVSYGIIAYLLIDASRSRLVRVAIAAAAIALVTIIGLTRIYLGIHSLSDVVTGYTAGGVWLWVCIASYRWASANAVDGEEVADADLATVA